MRLGIKKFVRNCIIVFVIIYPILLLAPNEPKNAHGETLSPKLEWKHYHTGKVVDVDPYENKTAWVALFVEFEGHWMATSNWEGKKPTRGEYGTIYRIKETREKAYDKYRYKWVMRKEPLPKPTKAKVASVSTPKLQWKLATINFPPINKTVLVKYKNGITITTAYLNHKKEWKLETDRNRISGGRTIDEIKEWVLIPN